MKKMNLALCNASENWFGVLVDSDDQLVASAFGVGKETLEKHLTEYSWKISGQPPIQRNHRLASEMADMFYEGKATRPSKLSPDYISVFQASVYEILGLVPKGRITTYGLVSRKIGSGPRAVGTAVASNPWPLFVPCHRVVLATLSIGNYSMCGRLGREGSFTKRQLLEREGVPFQGNKIAGSAVWNPSGE